jgi:SAM-dependent methyltransferase
MSTTVRARPGLLGRVRSRQAGLPSGVLGRIVGRAMVKDTAESNDRALAMLDLTQPCTVLDVGFGQGRTAAVLLRAGHQVIGVDASATMVKQATARNRAACRTGRATLRHGNGVTIPFPDHSTDAAITVHTIYFMPDPSATIREIARVLRPAGTLVIACRTSDDPTPAWMDPDIYRIPSASAVRSMLHDAGLTVVDHQAGDTAHHNTHLFVAHTKA